GKHGKRQRRKQREAVGGSVNPPPASSASYSSSSFFRVFRVFRGLSYFFPTTFTSMVSSNFAISPERIWAFLPSRVQPARTLTTLPRLAMRMLVGIDLASKVFQAAPLGSASQRKLRPFLTV